MLPPALTLNAFSPALRTARTRSLNVIVSSPPFTEAVETVGATELLVVVLLLKVATSFSPGSRSLLPDVGLV